MDISGRDLQQLCVAAKFNTQINRTIRAWIDADTDAKVDSRMIDQWIESDFKTAFNCLLNSYHATEKSIQNFLNQQINSKDHFVNRYGKNQQDGTATNSLEAQCTCYEKIFTPLFSLSNQDLRGITPLHVAVYRNSLHVDKIADLMLNWKRSSNEYLSLDEDTKEVSLASIPMACGSYPLHILTGQNLTLKEELLKILLHADPKVPFIDDVNGDNPISLLWKNTLRFRWAISVMEGATFIEYIKNDDCSWMAVITPRQYIEFSLLMAEAALNDQNKSELKTRNRINTIHDICKIPRCPPMLLRLLRSSAYASLFGFSGTAYSFDKNGMLPIHYAVQKPPVTFKFISSSLKSHNQKSLVEILLEENPIGAKVTDNSGRLPIHYALESGCSLKRDIMALIRLYPGSLRIVDPVTGLLPFMLVSTDQDSTIPCKIPRNIIREKEEQRFSTFERTSYNATLSSRKHQADWKKDRVKMIYVLLMLCPDVIRFRTPIGIHTGANLPPKPFDCG